MAIFIWEARNHLHEGRFDEALLCMRIIVKYSIRWAAYKV